MSARVAVERETDWTVDEAVEDWMANWSPYLFSAGFHQVGQTATSISYVGRYLALPTFLLGLITFPIGILLWVFVKRTIALTVTFRGYDDATVVTITGYAYARIRRTFGKHGFHLAAPS